jgi:hypothetical protein
MFPLAVQVGHHETRSYAAWNSKKKKPKLMCAFSNVVIDNIKIPE